MVLKERDLCSRQHLGKLTDNTILFLVLQTSSFSSTNDFLSLTRKINAKELADNRRIGRIIAKSQRTKTAVSFQTTTAVVPLTCALSNAVATACLKRRRRRTTPLEILSSQNELGYDHRPLT